MKSILIEIVVNGQPTELVAGSSIADLLAQLKITSPAIAVEVNQEIQSADHFATLQLQPHDILEVVTLVGGG